jgi:hypothetical protein
MHRAEQASLPDCGYYVCGHHNPVFDPDFDVGVAGFDPHSADAAHHDIGHQHRRIRFEGTDVRGLNVIQTGVASSSYGTGQRQGVDALEGASGGQHGNTQCDRHCSPD